MKEESRFVVCIVPEHRWVNIERVATPQKGEIYEVLKTINIPNADAPHYILKELTTSWNVNGFRPVNSSFGEVVCSWAEETILKIAQLEEAEA